MRLYEHEDIVDSWCVVDDEVVDIEPYVDPSRIVKTDMRLGLTKDDALRIIAILNKGE